MCSDGENNVSVYICHWLSEKYIDNYRITGSIYNEKLCPLNYNCPPPPPPNKKDK